MADEDIITKECASVEYTVYVAGSYEIAMVLLRSYCDKGFCVSVHKVDYVYKYGSEAGVAVKIINYPRFPSEKDELKQHALNIGRTLMNGLDQGSYTIIGPDRTYFFSRRDQDKPVDLAEDIV